MGAALRPMLKAVVAAVVFIAALAGLEVFATGDLSQWNTILGRTNAGTGVDAVTMQHLQTIFDGWVMFLAQPLFGAGLGAYMSSQIGVAAEPQVIHSTPMWLLAETGVIGFAVFGVAALRLFFDSIRHRGERTALLLMLVLGAIGTMSMAHEMLYQRAFWLLLGAILAMPSIIKSPSIAPSRPATV